MFEISKYKKSNVKISIRLPENINETLKKIAKKEDMSFNNVIVSCIQNSLDEMDLKKYKDVELDEIKNLVTGEQRKTGLPKSNVLYYELENNAWCCVRPSGTEPKIKLYMGVKADSIESAEKDLEELKDAMVRLVK